MSLLKENEGAYMEKIDNKKYIVCDGVVCSKIPDYIYRVKIYDMKDHEKQGKTVYLCASCAKKEFPNFFKKKG